MTSFEGDTPSAVSDALAEAADPATVIADEAAEHLEDSTAAEAVQDAAPADEVAEARAEPMSPPRRLPNLMSPPMRLSKTRTRTRRSR